MIDRDLDADVIIVGFGPTGAALAGLLCQKGLSVIAVERAAGPHLLPRAVHFDAEIMRIFQSLGVADSLAPHIVQAADYEFLAADGQLLLRIPKRDITPLGWASGYMFHQPSLERVLADRALAEPNFAVRMSTRFESCAEDEDGISLTVIGPDGARQLRCRYLVACDGGPSPVREYLGLALEDLQFDEPWLVVDVKLGAGAKVPGVNLQICDPRRPTTCVITGPMRHRWEFMALPGETPEEMTAAGFAEDLIDLWKVGTDFEIERKAIYRFHGLLAREWRKGRVLLAGDAAHQMPPMAGQGMCSGIRDAFNLAWKLALVVGEQASQSLLDSYQRERSPHAREVIEFAIGLGRVVCTIDPDMAAARDAQMLATRADGGPSPRMDFKPFSEGLLLTGGSAAGEMFPQPVDDSGDAAHRLDDVLGDGAWLLARTAEKAAAATRGGAIEAVGLDSLKLAPFASALRTWLDDHATDAVLVRPDRVVYGTGDAAFLAQSYRSAIAPAMPAYI